MVRSLSIITLASRRKFTRVPNYDS